MKDNKNKDADFIDAEDYTAFGNKNEVSFRSIVLGHIQRIALLASKEWRGGYWQERTIVTSGGFSSAEPIYVPDSREEYSNAVDYLADLLFPHFDSEVRDAETSLNEELEEVKEQLRKQVKNTDDALERFKEILHDEKVKIKRKLFRHLCSFLYRRKYLELGVIED